MLAEPSTPWAYFDGRDSVTAESDAVWIGIDIGKAAHHAAAIDNTGRLLWSVRVHNDQHSIEQLLSKAESSSRMRGWAVDLTSPESALLLAVLIGADQAVTYVPGRVVHRMTGAFPGEGKTDGKDAVVIAETARLRRDLSTVTAPDDVVAELGLLTGYRADLMGEWVSRINRLRSLLLRVFPELERAFDYTTRTGLALVSRYCTPAAIRGAGAEEISVHLRELGVRRPTIPGMVSKALAAAEAQTMAVQAESTTEQLVTRLARQLLDLDHEIKALDKQITACFRSHRQAQIIESVPGVGERLGAEFLAITAGDLAAFGTAGRLASYAGLAPVPNDSGTRSGVLHRPKRYHRRLRHVFYMAAFSSAQRDGPSREFYQRKRAEHQRHTQATIALARRLVDVLWALIRDDREWQPERPSGHQLKAA
ncbi:transposase IS116/IS110/IS902 family protein [Williamsia limnetica]|uniref:Transposase IS116/IS110/IS902 family protein n=1 Tax=Williamsia limnetica TaxID=882452 RepID=A0A318RT71_WILLI|nr:transposase IS116/IS110/IS902 family protein [Williamsia limnetica]